MANSSKGMLIGAVAVGIGACALVGFGTWSAANGSMAMGRARMESIVASAEAKSGGGQSVAKAETSASQEGSSGRGDTTSSTSGDVSSSDGSSKGSETSATKDAETKNGSDKESSGNGSSSTAHADAPGASQQQSQQAQQGQSQSDQSQQAPTQQQGQGQAPQAPTQSQQQAQSSGGSATYAVTWGDVLGAISARTGVPVAELAEANGVSDLTMVCTSPTVVVPDGNGGTVVGRG